MNEENNNLAAKVAANTILVSVQVSRWGVRRKVGSELVAVTASNAESPEGSLDDATTDPGMLRVTKRILDCDEYKAIETLDGVFYREMMCRVISGAYRKGVYHLPLDLLGWFETEWRKYEYKRAALIDTFLSVYDEQVELASRRLGVLFDSAQYPTKQDVRVRFGIRYSFQQVGVPDALADIDMALYEEEKRKLAEQAEKAAQEIRDALRIGLLEMVTQLKERLEPDADGKPKRIHTSSVEAFREFLGLIQQRNVTEDTDLMRAVQIAQSILGSSTAQDFRDSIPLRDATVEGLRAVADMAKVIVGKRIRVFSL